MNYERETVYKSYNLDADIAYESLRFKSYPFDDSEIFMNHQYRVVNYDKKTINDISQPDIGIYRSVIFSEIMIGDGTISDTKLLCFTPPKSISYNEFILRYPVFDNKSIILNETVEGTMMSLFYNFDMMKWEISTKGAISGNYYYYRTEYANVNKTQNTTFRKMFMDALKYNMTSEILAKDIELDSIPFVQGLPKQYCYNFVVQHPENHIVKYIMFPRLAIISVYEIFNEECRAVNIPRDVYQEWDCFIGSVIEFPIIYSTQYNAIEGYNSYNDILNNFGTINCPSSCLGITMTHSVTGDRTRIDNPAYLELKELRGNNANMQYYFLCLMTMNKVEEFLYHFPSYIPMMMKFDAQYRTFAKNIHKCYMSHYVFKNRVPIPQKYYIIAKQIHYTVYIPSISPDRSNTRFITLNEVFNYLLNMEPRHLLFAINKSDS